MKLSMMVCVALLVAYCVAMLSHPRGAMAAEGVGDKKILIAYFSWSGNTREIAGRIRERIGGDLFEIKTVNAYPTEYRACTDVAKKEQNENARPALSTKVENMDDYDVIFIGYPIWWGTAPMALFTFVEQYDFSGKTMIPFCTHGGSGLSRSASDIQTLCPKSTLLEGIAINGSGAKNAQHEVDSWLKSIGMAN